MASCEDMCVPNDLINKAIDCSGTAHCFMDSGLAFVNNGGTLDKTACLRFVKVNQKILKISIQSMR